MDGGCGAMHVNNKENKEIKQKRINLPKKKLSGK